MKINRSLLLSFILMIVISALYRILPNRPMGFAPQIAMGLFSGALFVRDKKWAFALPVLSLFISDLLYQFLYNQGLSTIQGFYDGQWVNYLFLASMTFFGFWVNTRKPANVALAALSAPTAFFLMSNFNVWLNAPRFGLGRPQNFQGLILTYQDALPFYKNSIIATVVFSAVLFGTYYLLNRKTTQGLVA
jgi:uncharacterized membrane protein (UPF0136 family)